MVALWMWEFLDDMKNRSFYLREKDNQKLKQIAEQRACSENAVIRQLIQGAEIWMPWQL